MISNFTKKEIIRAIKNPDGSGSGSARKKLQATYDKMLDEVSVNLFGTTCHNRMSLRQKLNSLPDKSGPIGPLLEMMKNEHLLFNKDYRDHNSDIKKFLTNHVTHFLRAI